ncbi:GPI-anchored cell surface glycoprotein, putative [Paecilomyces variotii No. 5]|uniref:GPI-anchored cell surface glycoprotein, putative n=1 Tax=Byssochlamys spectabilis (strain No. 5 / NBRC 109023) TaxID=1356009 RepID=V5FKP5_BYSSN|nr:GPI-anchored cell surface glycoprotein, putative [Paecilomyces variotii No. 5]
MKGPGARGGPMTFRLAREALIPRSAAVPKIMAPRRSSQRNSLPANPRRQPETRDPRHSSRKILNLSAGKDGEWTLSCVTKPYPMPSASEAGTPTDSSLRAKRRRVQKTPNVSAGAANLDSDRSRDPSSDINQSQAFTMDKKPGTRQSAQKQRKEPAPPKKANSNPDSKSDKDVSNLRNGEEAASEPRNETQKKSLRLVFSRNPVDGRTTLRTEKSMPVDSNLNDEAFKTPTPATRAGRKRGNASNTKDTIAADPIPLTDTPRLSTSRQEDKQNSARAGRSSQRKRNTLDSYFPSESPLQDAASENNNVKPLEIKLKLRQPAPPTSGATDPISTVESPRSGRQSRRRAARKDNEKSNEPSDQLLNKASSISPESAAITRTSSRVRKPTAKAIEALEQMPRSRKTGGSSDRPSSSSGKETAHDVLEHANAEQDEASAQLPSAAECELLGKQLYELAAAALAPDFKLSPDQTASVKRLREKYDSNEQAEYDTPSRKRSKDSDVLPTITQPEFALRTEILAPKLDHPGVSRPWTDEDGWIHTGQVNAHGEEIAIVPETYTWIETTNTHGDKELPKPPPQIKSLEQIEKDKVFGFPPRMGERNLPQGGSHPFATEDVDLETAKIRARKTAKSMGLTVDRSMSLAEIETLIHGHDVSIQTKKRKRGRVAESVTTRLTPQLSTGATRKRRRTDGSNAVEKPAVTLKRKSPNTNATDKSVTKKRRVSAPVQATRTENSRNAEKEEKKVATTRAEPEDRKAVGEKETEVYEDKHEDAGPGGRPRRRAAAAMLAQIQSNAEARARKARVRGKGSETPSSIQEDSRLSVGVGAEGNDAN